MKKFDKAIYGRIAAVSLPIILQNLLDAAVNSADVVMLGYVGQSALSAVSLANEFLSVMFNFLFGIGTGVSMLSAQYWGKKDARAIERVEGLGLRFSLSVGSVVMALCLFCPELVMRIFTNDEELILLGARYLRVWAPSIILWAVGAVYMAILRCIDRVGASTWIEAIALGSNVLLNAVFIFGLFGAPKLGVVGVALATTISRGIQLLCCVIVSERGAAIRLRLRTMLDRSDTLRHDFITMALPAIANDVVWGAGFSMYSVIMGHLGSDVVAANSIVSTVRRLGCVLCYAVGSAAGIIVGQILGENKIEEAKDAGRAMLYTSVFAGVVGGLIVLAMTPLAMNFATLTETAKDYLRFMLGVNVFYIMGTAINTTLITGVFRAGGDSRFGFICDIFDMWVYAVPLGFIAAFVLRLPVKVVYLLLCTDEFVKWPWVFANYYSYKWAKNITRENTD